MKNLTMTKIIKTTSETKNIKTIFFTYHKKVEPGQFFMIWIPGIDEIPMSVSYIHDTYCGITFKKIGSATSALYDLPLKSIIGVRGPYGNSYKLPGSHILFIGGGTGIATLTPLVDLARKKRIQSSVVYGARTKKELFFIERLKKTGAHLFLATDDGSEGFQGFASALALDLLKKNRDIDSIITCGPEPMMKVVLDGSSDRFYQASLERYMKCAVGICGQCCIGGGLRVCVEGTIFDGETLKSIQDFGVFKRDAAGRKIRF